MYLESEKTETDSRVGSERGGWGLGWGGGEGGGGIRDGDRGFTFYVAACTWLSLISVAGSNHFGIAGWYSMRAMEQGLLVTR